MKYVKTTESKDAAEVAGIEEDTDVFIDEDEKQLSEQLLIDELATLRQKLEQVKREKVDLEVLLETKTRQLQQCTTLPERETLLQLVLDNIPQLIFWKDRNSVFQGSNRLWAEASNLDHPLEVIGKSESDFHKDPKTIEYYLERDRRVIDTGEPELYIEYKPEKDTWFDTKKIPIHDSAGNIVGLLGTIENITQRKKAEEALRQSEARNRALLNAIPDLLLEVSAEGIYLDSIEAKEGKWLVVNQADRVGKHVHDVLPTAVAQQYMQAVEQVLQNRKPVTLKYEFQIGDEIQTFEARVAACRQNSALFLVRNITEHQQAEAALVKSEERFRGLVANIPGAIYRSQCNTDLTMEYISDAIETISGYPASDFIQNQVRTYTSIIHPDDRDLVEVIVNHGIATQEPYVLDYRMLHQDGSIRWVYEQGQAVFDANENPLYLDGAIFDITERKQAEEALRIAEENYRSIFENALEGIFQSTPDGQFISVNPAMASIHGYDSPEEMRARVKEIGHKIYVDPNCRDEFKRLIEEKGEIKDFEYQVHRQDGSLIWVSENTRAVHAASGQLLYYEGIIQNITERKQEESALKQQVQELRIEIDQQKRTYEVAEIIQSQYFQELQADVESLLLDDDE